MALMATPMDEVELLLGYSSLTCTFGNSWQHFQALVHTRPPHTTPCNCFHPSNALVLSMKVPLHLILQLLQHNHSYALQDTVTFNRVFMFPVPVGLETTLHPLEPTRFGGTSDFTQQRILSSAFSKLLCSIW